MIKAVSLLSESCDAQLGMLMIQQTAKRNRQMDGKSVAAAHIHKRIRGAAMLIFPPRHMHMRLVSALSAARGVCVCSSARRQKSCTLRHTLASVDIWNSACWLCRRSSSCANIDTIVHSRRWQWWDCLLVVAIAFRNVAGVSSTEPRATAWTLCVCICLCHPSCLGSRLPSLRPITNRLLVPSMAGTRVLTVHLCEPTCEPEPFPLLSTVHVLLLLLLLSTAHLL